MENYSKKEYKTVPKTKGVYGMNKAGEVVNFVTGKPVRPFRPGGIKLKTVEGNKSLSIKKIKEEIFAEGYVSDDPIRLEGLLVEMESIERRIKLVINKLKQEIKNLDSPR